MAGIRINIDRESNAPAYRQIYQQIAEQIREGSLRAGILLPHIRTLSQELGIARNTVEAAYKQLALEGYATGHRGKGYIVEDLDISSLSRPNKEDGLEPLKDVPPTNPGRNPLGDSLSCKYDFSYGNRCPDDFPMQLWRTHAEKVMTEDYAELATSYMDPMGLPALRREIASYLGRTRNVVCDPRQIALLPGTQTTIQRICMLFSPEDRVAAMEEPGYDSTTKAIMGCGWELKAIPTHKNVKAYLNQVEKSGARLLYCTPSNQFPLGYILPIAARLELIGWAKRTNSIIIEDDYCCEYRYDGSSPTPSLQSLDPDHVIYMGTLSKVLTPAIRLSYIVLPPRLLPIWEQVHGHFRCPVGSMSQAILQSLMASSDWDTYVHSTTNRFHRKHATLMDAIRSELGDRVDLVGESAGLHLLVGDSLKRSQGELIELARRNDVRVYETHRYWSGRPHPMDNYVLLGFSAIPEEDIAPGIKALADAWYE